MILWAIIMGMAPARSPATMAYNRAMGVSDDLIRRMRDEPSPAAAVVGKVMERKDDTRFLTSMFEHAQEASTPRALPE